MKRSEGRSAVAASAYLSGTRLYCEYDHRFRDYSHKPAVILSEVLLPERAPPVFADRAALWNSVENAEKRYDSQLARRIIIALPKELSHEDNIALVRQYCREQFVSKGMCCDFAVHDEEDGNPHAHVLLTMRGLDEQGKWLPKSKSEFELDENGQHIRQKNGRWKCRKVNTVDWNDQKYCEVWRHEWELLQINFHGLSY
ncbi:MobQ family relaxase [Grylomicrobium aquisgranensis]|uniref:MobQ family relaxase n=1 Tax=Grylomicrobium aquisgranensis TaxID=2926318 RepID=UPI0035302D31